MDYNEILLQAVDTVIEARLKGLQYDKTVKCQVVESLGNGAYTVCENDSVKYDATVNSDISYSIDDYVYVLIPNGDYANPKIIVGKYTEDNERNPVVYLRPLDTFAALTKDITVLAQPKGLIANGVGVLDLGTINLTAQDSKLKYNSLYSTLGLSCDFKSLFNGYNMVSGNYGLRLYLLQEDNQIVVAEMDSSDWLGNPYRYDVYFNQTFTFDISSIKNIRAIRFVFYQNSNFVYLNSDGERVVFPVQEYANIFAKNLKIQLGESVVSIPDDTFQLMAVDEQANYSEGQETKELAVMWYNKDEENRYIGFTDGIVDLTYDEDEYNKILDSEYLGGFEAYENVAPLKDSYAVHKNYLKACVVYDNLESTLTNLYNNVVSKAITFLGDTDSSITNFYRNTLKPYQVSLGEIVAENEELYQDFDEQALADYESARQGLSVEKIVLLPKSIPASSNMWTALEQVFNAVAESSHQQAYFELLKRKWSEYKKTYEDLEAQIQEVHTSSTQWADSYYERLRAFDLTSFEEEYTLFASGYANRYCIYWYKANLEAIDKWLGDGWERIAGAKYPEADGDIYLIYNRPTADVALDVEADNMRFKAILFYNHQMFESNILTLENLSVPSEAPADISSALRIEHGTNSQVSYQKYGSNYVILKYSDSMANRQLKVQYQGIEEGNEALDNNIVYWYVPQNATMLASWESDLLKKGFSVLDPDVDAGDDVALAQIQKHRRAGYDCYYKTIASHSNEEDISFYYQINKVYNPAYTNNEIYCVLDRDGYDYEAKISFTFSTYGTAGTEYTLAVAPSGRQSAVEQIDTALVPLEVVASFTGYNGGAVEDAPELTFTFAQGNSAAFDLDIRTGDDNQVYCSIGLSSTINASSYVSANNLYNILRVSTTYNEVDMNTCSPIPLSFGEYYLKGASLVPYNSFGTILTTSNIEPYELFDLNTNEKVENVSFTMQYYNSKGRVYPTTISEKLGSPSLSTRTNSETGEATYTLTPPAMYVSGALYTVIVAWKDSKPLFAQPIYVYQDTWESSLLNGWDGNLVIDEENNYILSAMMGAGYKDSGNRFNGVLMGDLSRAGYDKVGLYGYHQGVVSFGFSYNGTAFLGKSGNGQIIFDGNNGTIISGNYSMNQKTGMKIDLEQGHIDAYNFRLTSSRVLIDSSENASAFFRIYDNNSKTLIYIGEKDYYLQDSSGTMKIDLAKGKIKAEKFELDAMVGGIGIKMTAGDGETTAFQAIADANNKIDFSPERLLIKAGNETNNVIIDSKGEPAYFKVGNTNNYIQLTRDDLDIKTNKIIIDAWNEEEKKGIYINSAPTDGASYFKVGHDLDNYLSFSNNGLAIKTQKLDVDSYSEDKTIGVEIHTIGSSDVIFFARRDSDKGMGEFAVQQSGIVSIDYNSYGDQGQSFSLCTDPDRDWVINCNDAFRIDWNGNVEAQAIYLYAKGDDGAIYFHSKAEAPSLLSERKYLRYDSEKKALYIMNTGVGALMIASYVGKFDTLVCLGEKTDTSDDVWQGQGNGNIRIASNVQVVPYKGNGTFTFMNKTKLVIKEGAQLVIEGDAGTLDLVNKGIVLKSSENDTTGIAIENGGSNILKVSNASAIQIGSGAFKLSSSAGVSVPISLQQNGSYSYISLPSLLTTEILASPTLWVGDIKNSSGTKTCISISSSSTSIENNLTITGSITNNGNTGKLGKLAFADYVKKKLDITMKGTVTVRDSVNTYFVSTGTEIELVPYVDKEAQTFTLTEEDIAAGTKTIMVPVIRYQGQSVPKYSQKIPEITQEITLRGSTGEIIFEPSTTETTAESITISGTQQ